MLHEVDVNVEFSEIDIVVFGVDLLIAQNYPIKLFSSKIDIGTLTVVIVSCFDSQTRAFKCSFDTSTFA